LLIVSAERNKRVYRGGTRLILQEFKGNSIAEVHGNRGEVQKKHKTNCHGRNNDKGDEDAETFSRQLPNGPSVTGGNCSKKMLIVKGALDGKGGVGGGEDEKN